MVDSNGQIVRRAAIFADRWVRLARRWWRRMRRVESRHLTLEPSGEPVGRALFSYILDPFLLPPGREVPHAHTHYWESRAIGWLLRDLGFRVDVIHWTNQGFVPAEPYDLLIDVRINLERLAPLVGERCLKVMHIETSHPRFHNPAQRSRLESLASRRGIRVAPRKLIEDNRAIELADCATILGNEVTQGTYRFAGKPLYPVPISQPFLYPFPEARDYAAAARRFVWFGSGGLVHKGLDVTLEAFAGLPDFHLTVCGPVERERDFERAFRTELYRTPNIRTMGWVDIAGRRFIEVAKASLAMIYPSCSEGQSGGTVTCMHAGMIPVVTREVGLDVGSELGVVLSDAGVETIRAAAHELAARPLRQLETMARSAYDYVREHHTRERFAERYRAAILEILQRFRPDVRARVRA